MNAIQKFGRMAFDLFTLPRKIDQLQRAIGRIELQQSLMNNANDLRRHEFKVYSQWGEDGIIQFLIRKTKTERTIFIEFGVQDYTESNTRFVLQHNNWSGLIIDGDAQNVAIIKADPINYRYALKAECAFIDRDNINEIITRNTIQGEIGLLSVDIDGNDYWVWEGITCVSPRIVVCEYNSLFGADRKVSIPYNKNYVRNQAHYSHCYYGASIAALTFLAQKKGYSLVGGNSNGNNVFFVRNDLLGDLSIQSPAEAYVKAQFRESRNEQGMHTFLDFEQSRKLISAMPLIDVETQAQLTVGELS